MAVIGNIRRRAGLLIGIVGFSLVAFILGDLLTSNRSFLGGQGTDVGEISGKKISYQDFEARVAQLEENYKLNTGSATVDQNTMESLRDQAWNAIVNEQVLGKQIEKTGIKVSDEELFDMIQGKDPHPQIKEAFKDPNTGQFSSGTVINFLKNMDNDQTGKTRAQWIAFEKYIVEERTKQKYNELVKKGMYVTDVEAKRYRKFQEEKLKGRLVDLMYRTESDSSVKFEEADITAYYNAHKEDYKQEEGRKLDYVIFEVAPSPEDISAVFQAVSELVQPFSETTNDSLFVAVNSDQKSTPAFSKKGTLSPAIDTVYFNGAEIGTIVGPYRENNFYALSKLIDRKMRPDSIKVSHALVAYVGSERAGADVTRTKEQAKERADSLFAIAQKSAAAFLDVATNQSDDKVSAEKKGDLDWMTSDSPMDPQFKQGAFNTAKGQVSLVESPFGFHIIRVDDQTAPQLQVEVATMMREIRPGSKTFQTVYAQANEFAGKYTTGEAFIKACEEQGLNKRESNDLKLSDKTIPGLDSPRILIHWAYQAKKGDVSKAYEMGSKFVVAHLKEVKEKGIAPLDQVRAEVTSMVISQKKGEMFAEKFNTVLSKTKDLNQIAMEVGSSVKEFENMTFNSGYVQNIGMEPKVVGTAFVIGKGVVSAPVVGQTGVFVLVVDDIETPPNPEQYAETKQVLMDQYSQRAEYELFNSLRDKAGIEDNRGRFY